MKTVFIPLGRMADHAASLAPDVVARTACKPDSLSWDAPYRVQTWSNAAAMQRACQMGDRERFRPLAGWLTRVPEKVSR